MVRMRFGIKLASEKNCVGFRHTKKYRLKPGLIVKSHISSGLGVPCSASSVNAYSNLSQAVIYNRFHRAYRRATVWVVRLNGKWRATGENRDNEKIYGPSYTVLISLGSVRFANEPRKYRKVTANLSTLCAACKSPTRRKALLKLLY